MIELLQAVKAIAEALGLATAVVKLGTAVVEHPSSNTPDPEKEKAAKGRVSQQLTGLRAQTIGVCGDINQKIQVLIETTQNLGISQSMTIHQQLEQLHWYNFSTRSRLKGFREASSAAQRQLTSIVDDVTAMLVCNDQQGLAAGIFLESEARQKQLKDLMFDPTVTIGSQLKIMSETAREILGKLESQQS